LKPRAKEEKEPRKPKAKPGDEEEAAANRSDFKVKRGQRPPLVEEVDPLDLLPELEPSALQQRQQELEGQFLNVQGPLDAPERQALWPELAQVYTALGNLGDAAVCWANAL